MNIRVSGLRCIMVCVDYSDVLELTLPYNRHLFEDVMIVTSLTDSRTVEIANANGAKVHQTDAFYRRGAWFNKFAALEEGLSVLGREGWMMIMDADIALPKAHHQFKPVEGFIYTPHRRIKEDLAGGIPEERRWRQYKRPKINEEFAGYCQLFHGEDRLLGTAPWHAVDWTWAGGADSAFHNKWPPTKKVRPPFECLHLGPPFTNWCGRASKYKDGTFDPKAKEREEARDMFLKSRRQSGPLDRFRREKLGNTEE